METFCMVVLGGEYVTTYCWHPGVPTRFHVAYTSFDSLVPLVGGDSDLKSTEPWFSFVERNLPIPQIHWSRSKEWNVPTLLFSHT